ncbi:FecR family protein [Puteibacter caeruleilacunae]|nr:FecR family protein [Puteibacter caeruleilacunae]
MDLLKYLSGDTTKEERLEFLAWLKEDERNEKEFATMRRLYDIVLWQRDNGSSVSRPATTKKVWMIRTIQAAAVAVILISCYIGIDHFHATEEVEEFYMVKAPVGEHHLVELPDQTKVWLNSNTVMWVSNQFSKGKRNVKVNGEAFFEVTKNENAPFTVAFTTTFQRHSGPGSVSNSKVPTQPKSNTNGYLVKVLGTTFNVNTNSSNGCPKVSLLEGSVEVLDDSSLRLVRLKPNEEVLIKDGYLKIKTFDNSDRFQWRQGMIVFNNKSFEEIVRVLERTYGITISVEKAKILQKHCTGKFRIKDGVEHILDVLNINTPFKYEIDELNKTIIIK